jgi:phage tail sheath protein FI
MATLVSPGVDVTVVDESAYASPGAGTIPLIVVATAQDKTDPTGTEVDGIAKYTKASNANLVVPVTSQRELTQFFGDPIFASTQGAETSEYGLLAAYSYLGQGSQVYVVRANIDLAALQAVDVAPTGPANGNQLWIDTDASRFGLHVYDAASASWVLQSVIVEVDTTALSAEIANPGTYNPATPPGAAGQYLVAVLNDSVAGPTGVAIGYFRSNGSAWQEVTTANIANLGGAATVTYAPHYNAPAAGPNNIWIKTTRPGNGVNLVVYQSNSQGVFDLLSVEGVSNDGGTTYVAQSGASLTNIISSMTDNNLALTFTAADAGFELKIIDGGAVTAIDQEIYAQDAEPVGPATVGTYWYDSTMTDLDILIKAGSAWTRVDAADIYYSTTEPLSPTDGDIWVDTNAPAREYPKLYRYDSGATAWLLYDNTDQSTERGVIFSDFTVTSRATLVSGAVTAANLLDSAPNPLLYPTDMLAVNMARSSGTVRVWTEGMPVNSGAGTVDGWINAAGNNADGSGVFGRLAQRKVVTVAMQAAISGNEDLRDPNRNFTLLCAPNYPEITDELVTLNSDRGETGFIIIDTPMRLNPTEAVAWIQGVGATENGEDGLVTKNTYSAVYYPAGRSTTPAGNTVTVPASHMVLYTYAYNDNISYPWFAPAGLTRGIVQNGSAVGYITSEEEFKAVSLSQGQRDAAYLNKLNPIANFPLEGVVVYGQKTLHPVSSALDRVNVARLVAYLRERFDEIARPLLFEQNDKLTRDRARQLYESFLSDLLTKRALTDFAVVCDESNNTPIRIDRNELYIDVAIAPTKAVEFIYIPIRIVNTGAL